MRKTLCAGLTLALILISAGCGEDTVTAGKAISQTTGVNDVLEAMVAEDSTSETTTETVTVTTETSAQTTEPSDTEQTDEERQSGIDEGAPEPEPVDDDVELSDDDGIDIDLTELTGSLVYSEVYGMMLAPQEYIGKTIKMEGAFAYYYDSANDKYYFACVVSDATACCSSGIEFVLTDDYTYPDDYPEEGGYVCVTGVFDTYQEGEYTYCTLKDAVLE